MRIFERWYFGLCWNWRLVPNLITFEFTCQITPIWSKQMVEVVPPPFHTSAWMPITSSTIAYYIVTTKDVKWQKYWFLIIFFNIPNWNSRLQLFSLWQLIKPKVVLPKLALMKIIIIDMFLENISLPLLCLDMHDNF